MFIITHKKIFLTLSLFLVVVSFVAIGVFGLKLSIDFTGGAQMDVTYTNARPELTPITNAVNALNLGETVVEYSGTTDVIIKSPDLTEDQRVALLGALSLNNTAPLTEKSFTSIGPSVGNELATKAILSIILVIIAIILFIAFAFRKVSEPISSWKYGIIAVVTLVHDIIIPTGFFVIFSHYTGAQADTLFVVALLTILGISINDKIVVFDRIRENLKLHTKDATFPETVGKSISQTLARSINTSLTVIIVLLALFIWGPATTKNFALILVVGMFIGTYSSIFVASPILVLVEGWQKKRAAGKK